MRTIKFGGIANMGKRLAIQGHPTRGNEVIELLEMLGGCNIYKLLGNNSYVYYTNDVCQNIIRGSKDMFDNFDDDTLFFTLEEFLNKYPYKVGDKIPDIWGTSLTVKSMSWDENYKTVMYSFEDAVFVARGDEIYMTNTINNHTQPSKMKNVLAELLEHIKTTPKEELEKEFKEIEEWSNVGPTVEEFMTFCESVNKKPKKPIYPTTYTECKNMIPKNMYYGYSMFMTLQNLIICRDVYWQIYGKHAGLEEPWKPDWNDHNQPKFGIHTVQNNIRPITLHVLKNLILVFPTEEIRDIFYENFKEAIEQCKELL